MTSAAELLSDLRQRGVELVHAGGRIRYRPQDAVTPELRSALIERKADLLMLLAEDDHDVSWRADAMRPHVPPTGPIPTLTARPRLGTSPGCCISCGEPLPPENRYRCEPCVKAAWQVLREVRGGGEGPTTTGSNSGLSP